MAAVAAVAVVAAGPWSCLTACTTQKPDRGSFHAVLVAVNLL